MKISASIYLGDIVSTKKSLVHKLLARKQTFKKTGFSKSIAQLKNAGVSGIELGIPRLLNTSEIKRVESILKKNKIKVYSIHQPIHLFKPTKPKEITSLFLLAQQLHAKVIVLHIDSAKSQLLDPAYISFIKKLEKKYAITAGFENSQKHHVMYRNPVFWHEDIFQTLMHMNDFHITLDTTHLAQAGGGIVRFILNKTFRIVNIHINDYKHHAFAASIRPTTYTHMAIGAGELPIKRFLQTLKKIQYTGLITMEINDSLENICQSAKMIKKFIT